MPGYTNSMHEGEPFNRSVETNVFLPYHPPCNVFRKAETLLRQAEDKFLDDWPETWDSCTFLFHSTVLVRDPIRCHTYCSCPAMKDSTRSWASLSVYWIGGDFMK